MAHRRLTTQAIDFTSLRRELDLPDGFPPAAQAQAEQAAREVPLPGVDRTDIPFVTVDPASSRDLDQAVCLRRRDGGGYRVHYAIADVAAYVPPGSALEAETWKRGQTVYLPDGKVPLHPTVLSEGTVSLLPEVERAAVVWTIDVSADGDTETVTLQRARVRSRAKLAYDGVQSDADAGKLAEPIALLPELGKLLIARALERGAINLPMPEQEIEPDGRGWRLSLRAPLPSEEWNAQISLLTGRAAAEIMLKGRIGLLRTMPAPDPHAVARLRLAGQGLGIDWPDGMTVGQVIARLDCADPKAAAFIDEAAELLRGAGYTPFAGELPAEPAHAAVASTYAHVTAPLRRLADRYATEVCLALHEGRDVPAWAAEALPQLPGIMIGTGTVASAAERGAIDLVEAVVLADRIGETFPAAVLDTNHGKPGGTVALDEPAVRARCDGELTAGDRVTVRLTTADPAKRLVRFALA
ncbi:RNB domain-containing ribonuclease [Catellatospora tritici]|uniref:RNB domain-containing ribonuclease n=1 Tax=Catellatospora tritici TaxID=2851566 RepID=UPI001C2D671D|nr:RNB domain-containing ribonuclease [Catellatospora tritici]MBV1848728.1 RNB domain-containing ribonuclease [Catellatospora tritici]